MTRTPSTSSSQTTDFPKVAVKESNQGNLGLRFEDEVAVSLICTLDHNKGLVKEMELPDDKFNDIVIISDVKPPSNKTEYEYFFYQLKHKKNSDKTLSWDILIRNQSNPFHLGKYYDSYEKLKNEKFTTDKEVIKELCIMTNAGLITCNKNQTGEQNQRKKNQITEYDAATYFCKDTNASLALSVLKGERYRFSKKGINKVTGNQLFTNGKNIGNLKKFLRLLVLHVNVTRADELEKTNNTFLRLFFPFHWDEANREERCKETKTKLLKPFENNEKATIDWMTVKGRCSHFNEQRESYAAHPFGSGVTSFDEIVGKELLLEFKLSDNASPWFKQEMIADFSLLEKIGERQLSRVLNIHSGESHSEQASSTQSLALKAYAMLRNESLHQRTRIIQVENEEGIDNIINYLTELEKQARDFKELITERLCCIVAFSENFEKVNSSKIMEKLLKCLATSQTTELRRWIQFIIVTQSALPTDGHETKQVFESVNDTLKWGQLSSGTMNWLLEKTLYVDENNITETTLKALGFDEKNTGRWMHPRALSELIVHCKEKPLSLALPKKDTDIETDYIERQVHLPLVRYNLEKEKEMLFTCDENDFNCNTPSAAQIPEYLHLLSPVASNRYKDACLWVKAKNGKSILELKDFVVRSKYSDYAINETLLLEDDVNFSTGSTDNKLLVVVDYPGKGKSCLLTKLSNRFLDERSSKYSNHLLLFVTLREIANWGEPKNGLEFLLDHSKALSKDSRTGNARLTKAIINKKCTSGPSSVFVLLDGYDEISDKQRQKTLNAIDQIKELEGVKRVILTSRPETNLENELEQRFEQFSLHLNKLTRADQISYLVKRWSSKLKTYGEKEESGERIFTFARKLVYFAARALTDKNKTFLDIPLQCRIFSECFYDELKRFLANNGDTVPQFNEKSFELLSLYDRFYETKIDVLLKEKANISLSDNETIAFIRNELKDSFLQSVMRLSIFHMMEEVSDAEIICRLNWDVYRHDGGDDTTKYSRDLKRAMKLGIVQGAAEGVGSLSDIEPRNIRFLHRTFAEYFFATYLFRHLAQRKSEFLDSTIFSKKLFKKSVQLIKENILHAAEYAGVRRFLDRMLVKHVPPPGKHCAFAKDNRSNVLEKRPVIAHEQFNEQLAKSIILKNAAEYTDLSFPSDTSASMLPEKDYARLCARLCRNQHDRSSNILMKDCEKVPYINSMLVHCIKEYATRENTSNEDREILAYSFMLSLVGDMGFFKFIVPGKRRREIFSCLLHWFDPAAELSTVANNMFSKWVFILLNVLSVVSKKVNEELILTSEEMDEIYKDLIVLTCEMLEYHRNDPDFDDNVFGIVSTRLFEMAPDGNSKIYAKRFFEVLLSNIEFWLESREIRISDKLFEGLLVSLNNKDVLSRALLRRLADFLADKLSQHTKLVIPENPITLNQLYDSLKGAQTREAFGECWEEKLKSYEKFLLGNVVRPYAFNEIVNFFLNAHIQGKLPEDATERLLNVSLEYIKNIQNLLFHMHHQVDLSFAMGFSKIRVRIPLRFNLKTSDAFNIKMSSISIILSYFIISDKILHHLSDPDKKSRAMQEIFFSEIGQKSLSAYARSSCCCLCMHESGTGFGIHFLKGEEYDKSIKEQFRILLSAKLEFLWKKRGEKEFVDFLFRKDETTSGDVSDHERENWAESVSSRQTEHFRRLKETESKLRRIHPVSFPCLLFSDLVSEYIPQKLSETGLQYLMNTLKKLPLFFCRSLCFPETSIEDLELTISDMKMSLFDGIMRNDMANSLKCRKRSAQIKVLREALQKVAANSQHRFNYRSPRILP